MVKLFGLGLVCVAAGFIVVFALPASWFVPAAPVLAVPGEIVLDDTEAGKIVIARFQISNLGGSTLSVSRFRTSCGCSRVEQIGDGNPVTISEASIPPGGHVDLALRWTVGNRAVRNVTSSVRFKSNDPKRPETQVTFVIPLVKGGLSAYPPQVVAEPIEGDCWRQIVEVRDRGSVCRNVTSVTFVGGSGLTARLLEVAPSPSPDERGKLIARIEVSNPQQLLGLAEGSVQANQDGVTLLSVPVRVRHRSSLEVSPPVVVLPRLSNTTPVYIAECTVRDLRGGALELTADPPPAGFNVTLRPIADRPSECLVRIERDPTEPFPGQHSRQDFAFHATIRGRSINLTIPCVCRRP